MVLEELSSQKLIPLLGRRSLADVSSAGGGCPSTSASGSDTFIIGDSAGVDYQSRGSDEEVDFAFAIISDFSTAEDFIQASGSSSNYELVSGNFFDNSHQDTGIYLGDDLIAVVENTTVENFDRFIFV